MTQIFSQCIGHEHGSLAHPPPPLAVGAGGIADERSLAIEACVPQVIKAAVLDDAGPVDVVFPAGRWMGAEDDLRLAPADAVGAFDQRDAGLRTPGKPHAVQVALLQHGDVEAGAILAAEYGIFGILHPAGRGFGSLGRGFGVRCGGRCGRRQPGREMPQRVGSGDLPAIAENAQALAPAVTLAAAVEKNAEPPPMVADPVETEIVPRSGRNQRIDLDHVVGAAEGRSGH